MKAWAAVPLFLFALLASINAVGQGANLTILKSVSQEFITPGGSLIYTLAVTNTGTAVANNVVLEDDLSNRLSFVSATAGGVAIGGAQGALVRWTFPSIAPGQSGSVSVVTSADFASDGQSFGNVATIDSDETTPVTSNNRIVFVLAQAQLELSKSVSRTQVISGETVAYTLEYRNVGGTDATNLSLSDVLDIGLNFISADYGGSYDASSRAVSWVASNLPAGQTGAVTLLAEVAVVPDNTVIPNTATLFSTETGSILSNEVDLLVSNEAFLDVTLTTQTSPVEPGGAIQYKVTVTNTSSVIAENVVVSSPIPNDTSYIDNLGGGTYNNVDQVSWNLGNLNPQQTAELGLLVEADTTLVNGDVITANTNAVWDNNGTAGAGLLIFVSTEPVLTLTKTASVSQVSPGDEFSYTLEYGNIGNAIADQYTVRDYLPTRTTFVSAGQGGAFDQGVITWNVGEVPPGAGGLLDLTVRVDSPLSNGTAIKNVAEAESLLSLPISSPTVTTLVSSLPDLKLTKAASRTVAAAGDQIVYTLSYQNTGTTLARDVVITDVLPPQTTYIISDKGGQHASGVVSWVFSQLQPGQSGTVSVTVEVLPVIPNGTVLHNTSTIVSDETSPAVAPLVNTLVNSEPDLTLGKIAAAATVPAGSIIDYTLSYANTGSDAATGVVVSDVVPDNTQFVSASDGGVFDDASNLVSWTVGRVPALSGSTRTMRVLVDPQTPGGTTLPNIASMTSVELPSQIAQYAVVVAFAAMVPTAVPTLPALAVTLLIFLVIILGVVMRKHLSKH